MNTPTNWFKKRLCNSTHASCLTVIKCFLLKHWKTHALFFLIILHRISHSVLRFRIFDCYLNELHRILLTFNYLKKPKPFLFTNSSKIPLSTSQFWKGLVGFFCFVLFQVILCGALNLWFLLWPFKLRYYL